MMNGMPSTKKTTKRPTAVRQAKEETVDIRSLHGILKRRGRHATLKDMEAGIRRGATGR